MYLNRRAPAGANSLWAFAGKAWVVLISLQYLSLMLGFMGYGSLWAFSQPHESQHHPTHWMTHIKRNLYLPEADRGVKYNNDFERIWSLKRNENMTLLETEGNETTTSTTTSPTTTTSTTTSPTTTTNDETGESTTTTSATTTTGPPIIVVDDDDDGSSPLLPSRGLTCPDEKEGCEYRHNQLVMFLLSFFLGSLGVARFVSGHICCGVAKILTCGGCGIWWLVDWILILTLTYCRDFDGCAWNRNM